MSVERKIESVQFDDNKLLLWQIIEFVQKTAVTTIDNDITGSDDDENNDNDDDDDSFDSKEDYGNDKSDTAGNSIDTDCDYLLIN